MSFKKIWQCILLPLLLHWYQVTREDTSFHNIMRCYRTQPHAQSHVSQAASHLKALCHLHVVYLNIDHIFLEITFIYRQTVNINFFFVNQN